MMDVRDRLRREVEAEENALNGTDTTTARVTFVAT
jgi:hypothetical protein